MTWTVVTKPITEDQHFVPRFYLKQFADAKGFVQVLDLKQRRVSKPRPYAAVGYERFFYATETAKEDEVSQLFEELFTSLEGQIAAKLTDILGHIENEELTAGDLDTLAYFLSLQWLRTDFFRQRLFAMEEDLLRRVLSMTVNEAEVRRIMEKHGQQLSKEQIRVIVQTYRTGDYRLRFTNKAHLQFLTPDRIVGFHNLFFAKKWNIIKRGERWRFITSDNPVAEWIPLRTGIYGVSFLERTHYLALSPDVLIECLPPDMPDDLSTFPAPDPVSTIAYRTAPETEMMMFNMVLADHSGQTYCYSQTRDELDELLKQLTAPEGPAFRMFYQRYKTAPEPRTTNSEGLRDNF
jgi:hypothetical protein